MLKRYGSSLVFNSSVVLKRHRPSVVSLPHDVVELILERLPVESLRRFRSVSHKWKSTIDDSRRFQERQLIRRRQSRGADVLFVSIADYSTSLNYEAGKRRIVLGSSVFSTVRFPFRSSTVCHGSCDGLLCLDHVYTPSFVINPATGWHRSFPHSRIQQLCVDLFNKGDGRAPSPNLGFGKDKLKGTYKPVYLYNSSEFGLANVTTCEVFDFGTNSWRYVLPASPYRINVYQLPVYLDGSLHWFTECEETKVLSFDLHSETFQVICKAPFANVLEPRHDITMSILDNRLCVSKKNRSTQIVWSFDSSGDNKTWVNICSIDLSETYIWFGEPEFPLQPVAILEKNKLLLQGQGIMEPLLPLVMHDLHTKSYDLLYQPTTCGYCVPYFQSLFTALSN